MMVTQLGNPLARDFSKRRGRSLAILGCHVKGRHHIHSMQEERREREGRSKRREGEEREGEKRRGEERRVDIIHTRSLTTLGRYVKGVLPLTTYIGG